MHKLKSVFAIILSATMAFSITACSGKKAVLKKESVSETEKQTEKESASETEKQTEKESASETETQTESDIKQAENKNEEFEKFCDDIMQIIFEDNNLDAHYLIYDYSKYNLEYKEEDKCFGEIILNEDSDNYDKIRGILEKLRKFDKSELTEYEQIVYDAIEWQFSGSLMYEGMDYTGSILNIQSGPIATLSDNMCEYVFYNTEDVEDYFLYLKDIPNYIDSIIEYMNVQYEKGYGANDYTVKENIKLCDNILDAKDNPFIITFDDRIDKLDISDSKKKEYKEKNNEYIEKYVLEGFETMKKALKAVKGKGEIEGGLCNFGEKGKELYEALFRARSSSDITVKEGIKIIEEDINQIVAAIIRYQLDDEFMEYVKNLDIGKLEPQEMVDIVLKYIENDFPKPATANYYIEYLNDALDKETILAYYMKAPVDNYNQNVIKINKKASTNALEFFMTVCHESFPGHLYSRTSRLVNDDFNSLLDVFSFTGFGEGYAEYASYQALAYLCKDKKLDQNIAIYKPLMDRLGYILYSRADIGINYEGWTLEEFNSFINKYYEGDFEEVYNIIVATPGTYLSYGLGCSLLYRLKSDYYDKVSSDNKDFNSFITEYGELPYPVYEKLVDREAKKAK